MKVLIITGWNEHQAYAAAMALVRAPEAEVRAAARSYLPALLTEVAGAKQVPQLILILGVSLAGDVSAVKSALHRLAERNSTVMWISALPLPEHLEAELVPPLAVHVRGLSLARVVRDELAPSNARVADDAACERIVRLGSGESEATEADERWRQLVAAAAAHYRRTRNVKPYVRAIRDLAAGRSDEWHEQLIAEHRAAGPELVAASLVMRQLKHLATQVGESGLSPVLITGESGTGKELLARHIHDCSERAGKPFAVVRCPGLAAGDCDRLFGAPEGDAGQADERVAGGTLVLDDVADLSGYGQALLAAWLDAAGPASGPAHELRPRLIALTRRNLRRLAGEGRFREELYWRLSVVPLHCPPLRQRREDIAAIANDLLYREGGRALSSVQTEVLTAYNWPGNVWQLRSVIERALLLGRWDLADQLGEEAGEEVPTSDKMFANTSELRYTMLPVDSLREEDVLRAHARRIYRLMGGNLTKTAEALGLGSVNTLKKRLAESGKE